MLKELDDYDWEEVFHYAQPQATAGEDVDTSPFDRESVVKIIGMVNGDNDGPEWVGVFKLKDGRYASIRAGCDYTGWG